MSVRIQKNDDDDDDDGFRALVSLNICCITVMTHWVLMT